MKSPRRALKNRTKTVSGSVSRTDGLYLVELV